MKVFAVHVRGGGGKLKVVPYLLIKVVYLLANFQADSETALLLV